MLTPYEKQKAAEAVNYLLQIAIKEGLKDGCDADYDGGSIGGDLRYIAQHYGLRLTSIPFDKDNYYCLTAGNTAVVSPPWEEEYRRYFCTMCGAVFDVAFPLYFARNGR